MPTGAIVMWSGTLASIPAGWVLCDGTPPTPDLRNRFVKGTAAGVDPGATGGAATHTHAGHAAHVVTQPSGHAAHVVTQPAAHVFTQPAAHADHVVTQPATHSTSAAGSGGAQKVNSGTHTGTAVDAHSAHSGGAVDAHSGAAVDAHSAHSGTAVDAHSAHDTPNSEPAFFEIAYIYKT